MSPPPRQRIVSPVDAVVEYSRGLIDRPTAERLTRDDVGSRQMLDAADAYLTNTQRSER